MARGKLVDALITIKKNGAKHMTHPTTLAMAEIKRALALADKADSISKLGGEPRIPTTSAAFGADIEGGPAWVALGDGKHVDGVLYRRVKRNVITQIPTLPDDRILPIKKICSSEFWETLDNPDKRQAGRCLMHLVSNKQVNLALVSLNGAGPQFYCKT